MIRDVLQDPDLDFLPIPDPGVKKAPDPGSATLLSRTDYWLLSSLQKPLNRKSMRTYDTYDAQAFSEHLCSLADPGCVPVSRIPFFHTGSKVKKAPDPGSGSATKNFKIYTQYYDVYPGSQTFSPPGFGTA